MNAGQFCYITTCKGRLDHLRQTLPLAVAQPGVSCVVVDYSCPDGAGDWVAENFPQVKLVRVTGEAGFNVSRARNLGAEATAAPWLGFFDADVLWSPRFAAEMVAQLQPGCFYRAVPASTQTWGSLICHRDDFSAVGGYDEAFSGWGGEDDDIVARLTRQGCTQAGFDGELVSEIPHQEEDRVRFHQVKDRRTQRWINMLYTAAKLDLMRFVSGPLALSMRQTIYAEVERSVLQSLAKGSGPAKMEIKLPDKMTRMPAIDGRTEQCLLGHKMVYTLQVALGQEGAQ